MGLVRLALLLLVVGCDASTGVPTIVPGEPHAVVLEPSGEIGVYDRYANRRFELTQSFTRAEGETIKRLWANGSDGWTPTTPAGRLAVQRWNIRDLSGRRSDARVIVVLERPSLERRAVGLALDGKLIFDVQLPPGGVYALPSPTGRWLSTYDQQDQLTVIDTANSAVVWRGNVESRTFSWTDDALVYTVKDGADERLMIQPLPAGAPRQVTPPAPGGLQIEHVSQEGMVFSLSPGTDQGAQLWFLSDDDQWTRVDPSAPAGASEHVAGLLSDRKTLAFGRRWQEGTPPATNRVAGRFDLQTRVSTISMVPAATLAGDLWYSVYQNQVVMWSFDTPISYGVATLPPVQEGFYFLSAVARDGAAFVVQDLVPLPPPELFDIGHATYVVHGREPVFMFDWAPTVMDRDGKMALLYPPGDKLYLFDVREHLSFRIPRSETAWVVDP
jgi:hypothetical protein